MLILLEYKIQNTIVAFEILEYYNIRLEIQNNLKIIWGEWGAQKSESSVTVSESEKKSQKTHTQVIVHNLPKKKSDSTLQTTTSF
jgi:hypothetical protein